MTETTERTEQSEQEVKEYHRKWYEPKTTSESQDLKNCRKDKTNA